MEKIKIYDSEKFTTLLNSIKIIQANKFEKIVETLPTIENVPIEDISISDTLTCSFCKITFEYPTEHRQHYKSDWHRYNLKQNLRTLEPISEENFIKLADDVSSISGSDTETEDVSDTYDNDTESESNAYAVNRGKIFFENVDGKVFSLYRNLLHDKKNIPNSNEELLKYVKQYNRSKIWTVLMLGGGHFAGAIFESSQILIHKTFHRYTVRARQGGSQSGKDASTHAKSAGANLRRYNEKSLTQEIENVLQLWSDYIEKSHIIFYRAVGSYNRSVFFGGKNSILKKNDKRLRTIPFITKRATFNEVKNVYDTLSTVELYDSIELIKSQFKTTKTSDETSPIRQSRRESPKNKNINRAKSREAKERPLPGKEENSETDSSESEGEYLLEAQELEINFSDLKTFDDTVPREIKKKYAAKRKKLKKKERVKKALEKIKKDLNTACIEGNIDLLKQVLDKVKEHSQDEPENEVTKTLNMAIDVHGNTVLHVAAIHNKADLIKWLMENESSPCKKNDKQLTPYTINADKEIRNVFRNFAIENSEKYNYAKAQIPVVVTTLTEEELAEKRKSQKKAKREREKEKRKENEIKRKEEDDKERFLKLSDREKRALAAERRIIAQTAAVLIRCFLCGQDMSGKVPFEYSGNRFCSISCLKAHRMQKPVILS